METVIKPRSANVTANGTSNPSMVRVSPEMATQWLETMQYEHQRSVRQEHVDYLAEEMRRGRFISGTQIHVVEWGDRRVIVDGQHRLWAVVESKTTQQFSVLRTKAERKEDVAWIYGNTDIGMRRTGTHLLGALELDVEVGCSKTEVRYVHGAINFMFSGCLRNKHPTYTLHRDDAVRHIRTYAPFVREYLEIIKGCEKHINRTALRSASLAVALLSLRFTKPCAEKRGDPSVVEFWKGAIFDDGLSLGDPRKLANRHLLNTQISGNGSDSSRSDVISAAYACRYLTSCLGAWMERRELTRTMVRDAHAPFRLYGVPNDVDQWW